MYKIICECGVILTEEYQEMSRASYFECDCGSQYRCFSEENVLENDCFECEKLADLCGRCKMVGSE